MRAISVIILLATLALPTVTFAEIQTFTATHTYILGDHDSKDDARQRCLLETKRKILEQAGVYIESASEVKDLQLTKDKITSFAAAVMHVTDTKENAGFENEHMTLTLTTIARVDLAAVRKQLAARQLDAGVRDTVAAQQDRLKYLEEQLEAMQQRQGGQAPGQMLAPSPNDFSARDLQTRRTKSAEALRTKAAQGDAQAQASLGVRYWVGDGVPQDYVQARQWWEQAAAQGHVGSQYNLGMMYQVGEGVPQDYAKASQWYEKAAAQGYAGAQYTLGLLYEIGSGVPQDYTMARQWYEKAAAQGDAWAQGNLGALYALGQGVSKDDVRALMWLNLAVAHSTGFWQARAVDNRDKVARSMTPAQIAEAQRLAQQCQARQFKGC
jgi:TPR repeat protein